MKLGYFMQTILSMLMVAYGVMVMINERLDFKGKVLEGSFINYEGGRAVLYGAIIAFLGLSLLFITYRESTNLKNNNSKKKTKNKAKVRKKYR